MTHGRAHLITLLAGMRLEHPSILYIHHRELSGRNSGLESYDVICTTVTVSDVKGLRVNVWLLIL